MPSFSIALTGLAANSVSLDTIGNNLANLNTTAFKDQTTTFSALFYQNLGSTGSGNALQVGLGTQVAGTNTDFSQGSLTKTTNSTDMALNGNGFFVVDQGNIQQLTRDGNFSLDQSGNLITSAGNNVMGYAASSGVVNPNTPLSALQVPVDATQAAHATGSFSVAANLNAATAIGGSFSTTITMYDSLGTSHATTVNFQKTADNTWNYTISLPPGDATGVPLNNTGTLTFDSSGGLLTPTTNMQDVTFPGMTNSADDMKFTWDLYDKNGAPQIGQTVGTSTATGSTQDGFASGSYQSFSVDASGVISSQFSNGQTQKIGQIAVASVTNVEGLTLEGGNNYETSESSGSASIGAPGAGGRATVEDDTLEVSNVDISTEFANLIVAQRAFEANSKTVTTFDTVTQETINMIR
jgi:flagellar hook protein FlgE